MEIEGLAYSGLLRLSSETTIVPYSAPSTPVLAQLILDPFQGERSVGVEGDASLTAILKWNSVTFQQFIYRLGPR